MDGPCIDGAPGISRWGRLEMGGGISGWPDLKMGESISRWRASRDGAGAHLEMARHLEMGGRPSQDQYILKTQRWAFGFVSASSRMQKGILRCLPGWHSGQQSPVRQESRQSLKELKSMPGWEDAPKRTAPFEPEDSLSPWGVSLLSSAPKFGTWVDF